jgi:hypothetical protein
VVLTQLQIPLLQSLVLQFQLQVLSISWRQRFDRLSIYILLFTKLERVMHIDTVFIPAADRRVRRLNRANRER